MLQSDGIVLDIKLKISVASGIVPNYVTSILKKMRGSRIDLIWHGVLPGILVDSSTWDGGIRMRDTFLLQ